MRALRLLGQVALAGILCGFIFFAFIGLATFTFHEIGAIHCHAVQPQGEPR